MLQVFDQRRIHGDRYFLTIDEQEIPECYQPLWRRLRQAAVEPRIADAKERLLAFGIDPDRAL